MEGQGAAELVNELSDEEYNIYIETLEAVIDVVYYANKKIKEEK